MNPCPSTTRLWQLLELTSPLSPAEYETLEGHVEACVACQERLNHLVGVGEPTRREERPHHAGASDSARERETEKRYWALVEGVPTPDAGELVHWVAKDEARQRMVIRGRKTKDAQDQPNAERRRVEARAAAVAACRRKHRSTNGPDQHPRDDGRRIPVFAQQISDAAPVTGAEPGKRSLRRVVVHDERWVVHDSRAGVDRAGEVVDLLSG